MTAVKSLDHFVLLTEQLEDAASDWARLGFDVRPVARHIELNTANCVIHFESTYLELGWLTNGPPAVSGPYLDRLQCGDGLAHVSLTSDDLEQEQARLAALGVAFDPIYSARRKVIMPDGSENETASNFFYLWRDSGRYRSLFFSEHLKPETIFIPEYEKHPNTAIDVTRLVYWSRDPDADRAHFSKLFGCDAETVSADGFTIRGGRGEVTEVLTIEGAQRRYAGFLPVDDPTPLSGFAVALHFGVRSAEECAAALRAGGVRFDSFNGGWIVDGRDARGCTVVFEPQP